MEKTIRIQMKTFVPFLVWASALLLQPGGHAKANGLAHTNASILKKEISASLNKAGQNILEDTTSKKATKINRDCTKGGCGVYAEVDKSEQTMSVYVEGELMYSFMVSTGRRGHETPNLDQRPAGPVYEKYTSRKYPEGDYQGMGNMPYAVFIRGGYAIHGTTPGSFSKLGKKASHGCIRLHPDDARVFYDLVNENGLANTWVTIKP